VFGFARAAIRVLITRVPHPEGKVAKLVIGVSVVGADDIGEDGAGIPKAQNLAELWSLQTPHKLEWPV